MRTRYKPDKPSVTYHVMTRVAQQEMRLGDFPQAKRYFMYLLDLYQEVFYVKIHAFICLDNHFHICLTVNKPELNLEEIQKRYDIAQLQMSRPRPFQPHMATRLHERYTDLSDFMWIINWRMALFHNKQAKTKGHFWDGRFKSKVIDSPSYLIGVITYIELNSVRANIVDRAEKYEFSSIYRIATQLKKQDAVDLSPKVGFLKNLKDGDRGATFIQLTHYIGQRTKNHKGRGSKTLISSFASKLFDAKALDQLVKEVDNRVASQWHRHTYSQSLEELEVNESFSSRRPASSAPL